MDNMIGKVLGNRYELIEKIGGGGMAVVYKAKCRLLNRFVAVKILRTDSDMTEDFIKRFKVEAQAAGSLSHPNIVSIYDVGNENDINYIVMEYVEGYTLKEVIAQSGKLTWKATVKIASQICSGLEHAHKNHIIHRDIKSQNILVNEELVAKVTDFGIARASSNSTITMAGNTIGSVHYFSPEQAKGQHTDEKSDIYSLGIVMYEMITGRLPFDADTPVSVALKQIQELPIPPIQLESDMPNALNDIILKALQKEPRLRYQSATEMLKDLQSVLANPEGTVVTEKNIGATTVMPSVTENMINERVAKQTVLEEKEMGRKRKKSVNGVTSVLAFFIALIIVAVVFFFIGKGLWNAIVGEERAEVPMPNLVGMTIQDARATLQDKKIEIKSVIEQSNEKYAKGIVADQRPKPNIHVKEGVATVELIVSTGKSEITIPNVTNYLLEEAKSILDKEELHYIVTEESSDEIPLGYVVRTSPEGDRIVSASQTVTIYVSSGPSTKKVIIPNFLGETLDKAKAWTEENNIKLTTKFTTNASKAENVVVSQSIDAESSVDVGSELTLTVNRKQNSSQTNNQKKQTIYLNLSNKGVGNSEFLVEVTMSGGGVVGKRTIYSKKHTNDDGEISLDIVGLGEAMIEVYIDGRLDSSQAILLQ